MNVKHWVCMAAIGLAIGETARADNWPQWRGPNGDGVSGESGLPTSWGPEENVAWKVKMPGWGASTPVIWDRDVFVTAQGDDERLLLLCIDRDAGKVRWQKEVARGRLKTHRLHNMASPSPVTDGKHVWVAFGTGDVACYDRSGERVWRRNLVDDYGDYTIKWGMAGSPAIVGDVLVMACMHQERSYVAALDKATGKPRWKVDRPTAARGESKDSYSTPVVFESGGRKDIIVSGADFVAAYDPADGGERWRCEGLTGRVVATPAIADGLIVATSAFKRGMLGIKPGGSGNITDSHLQWQIDRGAPDVPTPVVYRGMVFAVTDDGLALCLDAKSGEEVYRKRVGGRFWGSPVAADGRIYSISEAGECVILAADREFKKIGAPSLGEGDCLASPAISDGQIFLRSRDHLFCIGKRKAGRSGVEL